MQPGVDQTAPTYLTTKEVADLLRVKERKVYDLAAADEIPHRRITGKLLFPRAEIMGWIEGSGTPDSAQRPSVLTGSHDPLLDWAVRESGCGLATLLNGSSEGLDRYEEGAAGLTGLHIPDAEGWNIGSVVGRSFRNAVLIEWATRSRGLILAEAMQDVIRGIADLRGRRIVQRQPGSGASALLDKLLGEARMTAADLVLTGGTARTESDAAAAVAASEADAAVGIEAMARQFHLPFLPLLPERFDLLIDRRAYFTEPVQRLLRFSRTPEFVSKAQAMGGYDLTHHQSVHWLSA